MKVFYLDNTNEDTPKHITVEVVNHQFVVDGRISFNSYPMAMDEAKRLAELHNGVVVLKSHKPKPDVFDTIEQQRGELT